jgi:circadian clock protein KaiC
MTDMRVPTGVEGLDELIGGGLRQGKSYLISGETGTGKTTFCQQFLMKGLEIGEGGVYVTADEKPGDLLEDAQSFGFGLASGIDQKKIVILDYSSHFDQIREKGGEIDVRKIVGDLNKYIKQINARRLVIDPIAPFVIKEEKMWEVRSYIRSLFYALDGLGTTTLLGSAIPTGTNSLSQFGVEEFYASGIVVLSIARMEKMRPRRIMVIRKMRGSAHTLEPYTYDFEHGKGIVIQQRLAEDFELG